MEQLSCCYRKLDSLIKNAHFLGYYKLHFELASVSRQWHLFLRKQIKPLHYVIHVSCEWLFKEIKWRLILVENCSISICYCRSNPFALKECFFFLPSSLCTHFHSYIKTTCTSCSYTIYGFEVVVQFRHYKERKIEHLEEEASNPSNSYWLLTEHHLVSSAWVWSYILDWRWSVSRETG